MGRLKLLLVISVLTFSCAQVGLPTGGEVDSTQPSVVSVTPELGAINVETHPGGKITFEFDEFVNVRQLSAQLLVSPPLLKPVEWAMKGKSVSIIWNEELQKDKTYIFQFGDAIVDVNESNPASDLMHAFSTGQNLDTLSLTGSIVDVFTDEKQVDRRVFIYDWDLPVDSISNGSLPLFVTTSNKEGVFTVNYLPEGKYRALAIDDVDRNYVWTDGESLAIYKDPIEVHSHDTLSDKLRMQKTHDLDVKYFVEVERDSLGLVNIELSGELDQIEEVSADALELYSNGVDLWLWSYPEDVEKATVIWEDADTLIVSEEKVGEMIPFTLKKSPEGKQVSGSSATFTFSRPVTFVKPDRFKLTKADSLEIEIKGVNISNISPFEIEVEASFGRGDVVELSMFPGAVEGQGRQLLADTLISKWSTFKLDELAELVVDISADGWLELISANGTVVEIVDLEIGMPPLRFKNLTPGSYALRWLGDPNSNGTWDGVSLKDWRLPEPARVMQSSIQVKADWTHEVRWDVYE